MHPRAAISRPSPKRSMSCAGLDELDELLHGVDHVSAHPHRKRHQSLTNDSNVAAASFAPSSSPSRPPYPPPPASYPGALRRPDLLAFGETGATGGFALGPSTSPPFESRYCRTPSNQLQTEDYHRHSDEQSNNYEQDEYDEFNDEFGSVDAGYGGYRDYEDSGSFSAASPTPREPQEELEQRLKQRRGHFLPPSYRPSTSECSPREDFLVQAFGPSGFKLHGAVSSTGDDEGDDCGSTHSFSSGSSNNNREHHSSSGEAEAVDPDTELKMSFSELEADIRGAMHHHQQRYQQASKLPELADLSRQVSSSSHGQFGLNGGPSSKSGNNQDGDRVAAFGQAQAPSPTQERAAQLQSSSRPASGHSKGNGGVQTSTKWLRDEDERLRSAVARFSGKNWKMIAETLGNGRTDVQCLHRWNKVLKPGLIKGPWTPEEDRVLLSLITRYGVGKIRWCDLALHLPGRIGKQCRERWCNHLDSRIRKGQWTPEEDDTVFCWQQKLGNKWSEIAKMLPGRTENAVKNRFNSAARRKWLMNQANKPHSAPQAELNSPHQLQPQPTSLPHERTGYNSSNHPYSYNAEDVKVAPLPRSTPLVMPASAALMEGQRQPKFTLPIGRQLYAPLPVGATAASASSSCGVSGLRSVFRAPVPVGDDQSFLLSEPDHHVEAGNRNGSAALVPPPTFVPPPLNALLLPPASAPTGNAVVGGYNRNFHHLLSGPISSVGPSSSLFPFASHLPTQQQPIDAARSTRFLPEDLTDREHSRAAAFPPLHLNEVKLERNDLVRQSPGPTTGTAAAPDAGVAMDDENMSSFLDSVALELDDIME